MVTKNEKGLFCSKINIKTIGLGFWKYHLYYSIMVTVELKTLMSKAVSVFPYYERWKCK